MTLKLAIARIDHLIARVPDIEAAHIAYLGAGYPEAWPVGPFWPNALTSGIAMGGFNLELVEPSDNAPQAQVIQTLVFEPTSLDRARTALHMASVPFEELEKVESDPKLLALRGFPPDMCREPQRICTNLLPSDKDVLPFDFFFCDYTPFLRDWLSPSHPRLAGPMSVTKIVYGTPVPGFADSILETLGYDGPVAIDFERAESKGVIEMQSG